MFGSGWSFKGCSVCLDDLEDAVWEPYRRVRNISSDRALYRRLWMDPELRELCDIEDYEKPYHPSQLSRFKQRLGPERLEKIMENIVDKLRNAGVVRGEIVACDATFLKAYSKRNPKDDSRAILTVGLESAGLEEAIVLAISCI